MLSSVAEAAAKLQFGAQIALASSTGSAAGCSGEVPGLQPPSPRSCLTARQQQAVGSLLRVQALVEHFVAKHDEDRVTVRRLCRLPCLPAGLAACSPACPKQRTSAQTLRTHVVPETLSACM